MASIEYTELIMGFMNYSSIRLILKRNDAIARRSEKNKHK